MHWSRVESEKSLVMKAWCARQKCFILYWGPVCVCVCVYERERERQTDRQIDRWRDRGRETLKQNDDIIVF